MKKLIYLFMLIIPLSAQEAKDDPFHASVKKEVKEEVKECCQISKQFRGDRGDMRERMGAGNRMEMAKKQKIRQIVRLVAVGSLTYYIGYHEGEKHFKGGMKRRPYMGDRPGK